MNRVADKDRIDHKKLMEFVGVTIVAPVAVAFALSLNGRNSPGPNFFPTNKVDFDPRTNKCFPVFIDPTTGASVSVGVGRPCELVQQPNGLAALKFE